MKPINIVEFRKSQNLTQQELAEILGRDRRTIINYEQGKKIPATQMKILEEMISYGIDPKETFEKKTATVDDEDLRREIMDLKDHIKTLKQLIEEKDKSAEMYKNENVLLKQQIEELKST